MADPNDDAHVDHHERITALEKQAMEIATVKRLVIFLVGLLVAGGGGLVVTAIQDHTRLEILERETRERATSHRGTADAVGELRTDLRVLTSEVRRTNDTLTEVRERVTRIEEAQRTVRPPR